MDCILSEDSIEFNKAKEINSSIESKALKHMKMFCLTKK